jgi:hypothetical protein
VVYVLRRSRFEERRITVARRNTQGRVAIANGLNAGDRVALKDPTLEETRK